MPDADPRNRYPQWGPLVRIWSLLDEEDVRRAIAAGESPDHARLHRGETRNAWAPAVSLDLAVQHGFEPVIGWRNVAYILRQSEKSIRMTVARTRLPVYRPGGSHGRHPIVLSPLCQLVRWAELRLTWQRREGW